LSTNQPKPTDQHLEAFYGALAAARIDLDDLAWAALLMMVRAKAEEELALLDARACANGRTGNFPGNLK
jgi:hypothetical protein